LSIMAEGLNQFDDLFGQQYLPPLPTTRRIELLQTQLAMEGRCASCLRSSGSLTCTRCYAIKYCSPDCQKMGSLLEGRRGWKDHKEICNKIRALRKLTESAGDALIQEFGGAETFFKTSLVKRGLFNYVDVTEEIIDGQIIVPQNANERYILARQRLIEAYVKCGEQGFSSVAFRLAAENMLDLLCLTYKHAMGEHVRYSYCGWMVAGGMDQEALNYLCYFRYRRLSASPLPYLDLSKDEDIEGGEYLEMLKRKRNKLDWSTSQWFHDYMLIALIKYKRLQALLVQKQKSAAGWRTFLMGTNPRVGKMSAVLKIRGKNLIVEKIQRFVLNFEARVDQLTLQIQEMLTLVNLKNPLIIPGILDRNSIPEEPAYSEEGDVDDDINDLLPDDDDNEDNHGDDIHDACWALGNYGYAWNMSHAYTRVLKLFLDTGRVTVNGGRQFGTMPVEGFLQAAFDTDSNRFYGRKDDLFIGMASI